MKAFDNGIPPKNDVAVIKVTVNRNLQSPKFEGGEQNVEIFYRQPLGEAISTVHATDSDTQVSGHTKGGISAC